VTTRPGDDATVLTRPGCGVVFPQHPGKYDFTTLLLSGIMVTLDKQTKENKMMTRKDFVVMAEMIAKIANDVERANFAYRCLDSLKASNPRFNEAKFLAACKVVV